MSKTAPVLPKLSEQCPQLLKLCGMGSLHRGLNALSKNLADHFAQHAAPMLLVLEAKGAFDDMAFNPICIVDSACGDDSNESVKLPF